MIDIMTVRISLTSLEEENPQFGVVDIGRIIAAELNHPGKLFILHKSGTAVSDCTSTRGKLILTVNLDCRVEGDFSDHSTSCVHIRLD